MNCQYCSKPLFCPLCGRQQEEGVTNQLIKALNFLVEEGEGGIWTSDGGNEDLICYIFDSLETRRSLLNQLWRMELAERVVTHDDVIYYPTRAAYGAASLLKVKEEVV